MIYSILADIIVFIHFLYVVFAIGGEIFILSGSRAGWKWIYSLGFRLLHLFSVALVAVQALLGILCPLTTWEYLLREAAGQSAEWEISFMGRIFRRVIFYEFPGWFFTFIYIGFAVIVIATYILIPPRLKKNIL